MALKSNLDSITARKLEIRLPSAGIPYLERCPHFPETISVTPFTMEAEAILVSNKTSHEKMARITERVVQLPPEVKVDDLLVADQFVILAVARALTYGESYKFHVTCPTCRHREEVNVKIPDQLPVKVWHREDGEQKKTVFPVEVTLPTCRDRVALRQLTVAQDGDLDRFEKQMTAALRDSTLDAQEITYLRRLAASIVSVGGGVPDNSEEAMEYVKRLTGPDMAAFKKVIDESACGIDYEWPISCDSCQHIYSVSFPIARDFFRGNRS